MFSVTASPVLDLPVWLHENRLAPLNNISKDGSPCLVTFSNTEDRVEIMTRSEVFLRNFEVLEIWLNAVSSV